MPHLLLMEGNPEKVRIRAGQLGVRSASQVYDEAIRAHFPDMHMTVINGADRDTGLPDGMGFDDFDGMVISGSSLRAFEASFEVTNQIALLKAFAETGKPILGSCWGLQIAAVAGGGKVEASPKGREMGFARKIELTDAGRSHPYFAGKASCFDAPCIHYDEVTILPAGATLLAHNRHSQVQAAVIPLGRSEVWAVQYHPEFDLIQLAMLFRLYGRDLMEQGFFRTEGDAEQYRKLLDTLIADPGNKAAAWQLGIDADILVHENRRAEIINWVKHCIR